MKKQRSSVMYQEIQIAQRNQRGTFFFTGYPETADHHEILESYEITILGERVGRILKIDSHASLQKPWLVELDFLDKKQGVIPEDRRFYLRRHAEVFVSHFYATEILDAWYETYQAKPQGRDLALVGCGNIGSMFLDSWKYAKRKIQVFEPRTSNELRTQIAEMDATLNPDSLPEVPRILFLALKDHWFSIAFGPEQEHIARNCDLVISTMEGVSAQRLQEVTQQQKVVRIVPSQGGWAGKSMTFLYASPWVTEQEYAEVLDILRPTGPVTKILDEKELDLLHVVSACSPAFLIYIAEILQDVCEIEGLYGHTATEIARMAVITAGGILDRSPAPFHELRCATLSYPGAGSRGVDKLRDPVFGIRRLLQQTVQYAMNPEMGR